MVDQLIKQWNADPNGELIVKVYQDSSFKARVRGIFQSTRTVDIPSGTAPHLYEPYPLTVRANQRVEVVQGKEIVGRG